MNDSNERSTATSPAKVEETKLPKEYQPEILKAVVNEPILDKIDMYGVGLFIKEKPQQIGMTHGPYSNLSMALEVVPGDDYEENPPRWVSNDHQIIRFNVENTSDILYNWKDDRWILQEGAS